MSSLDGVIVLDKPKGFTSFDAIAVIRRITGQRRLGHTGTLDPNASGVLPVLLGTATKAQDKILNHDKRYTARFLLGKTTDTLDIWGRIAVEKTANCTAENVEKILPRFRGEINQLPPMYSAVQKNGVRLYDLARKGIEVERKSRKVKVYSLNLCEFDEENQTGTLEIFCSRGTYVRSLIDDIGKALNTGAVMTALRRTSACGFLLDDCVTLDEMEKMSAGGTLAELILPSERLFCELDEIVVSAAQSKRFANGGALSCKRTSLVKKSFENGKKYRIKSRESDFLGVGIVDDGMLKVYYQNCRP